MQYIVAFNMLVNSWDSFVTAQHKNKLYKSVEKGLTYEIDTKQKEKKRSNKNTYRMWQGIFTSFSNNQSTEVLNIE